MTEITVHLVDDEVIGLTVNGHAESGPQGEDIVCASISTLFEVLLAGAKNLPAQAVEFSSNQASAARMLRVNPELLTNKQWMTYSAILAAVSDVAAEIAENYPEYCHIEFK